MADKSIQDLYVDNPLSTFTGTEKSELRDSAGAPGAALYSNQRIYFTGYKVLAAAFTQSGSGAPTLTEYLNTIGAIVWTRSSAGTYLGTLVGAFPAAKFPKIDGFIRNGSSIGSTILNTFQIQRVSDDVLAIGTTQNGTLTDGLLTAQLLEIKVYL